jgi:hypothetical protein
MNSRPFISPLSWKDHAMARKGWASQCPPRSESDRSAASSRPDMKCVFRDADTLCGKLSNARFWRVFASLSGLCLGQSWLGQSPKRCACVAGWNVCTTRSKDVIRVAELGGDDLDDRLGVARIYFCALRNVETSSRPDCEPQSARPKIAAIVEVQDVRLYREYCIRSWEPQSIPPDRFGPCAGTPSSDTITSTPLR